MIENEGLATVFRDHRHCGNRVGGGRREKGGNVTSPKRPGPAFLGADACAVHSSERGHLPPCLGCVDELPCRRCSARNVVNVHAACRTSHVKTELSRLVVAPICRSVQSLIALIGPWIVRNAPSMLSLALLSSTGLSAHTISVGTDRFAQTPPVHQSPVAPQPAVLSKSRTAGVGQVSVGLQSAQ